jgi:hypothetical protein
MTAPASPYGARPAVAGGSQPGSVTPTQPSISPTYPPLPVYEKIETRVPVVPGQKEQFSMEPFPAHAPSKAANATNDKAETANENRVRIADAINQLRDGLTLESEANRQLVDFVVWKEAHLRADFERGIAEAVNRMEREMADQLQRLETEHAKAMDKLKKQLAKAVKAAPSTAAVAADKASIPAIVPLVLSDDQIDLAVRPLVDAVSPGIGSLDKSVFDGLFNQVIATLGISTVAAGNARTELETRVAVEIGTQIVENYIDSCRLAGDYAYLDRSDWLNAGIRDAAKILHQIGYPSLLGSTITSAPDKRVTNAVQIGQAEEI